MNERERARLMDAVLDGEATPSEARELDRLLAIDSAARTEFEQLKKVFEALRELPQAFPPEGLVAAVLANIPQNLASQGTRDQLSSRSRVIGSANKEARGTSPGKSVKGPPVNPPAPFLREWNMNESNGSSRRRNVWVGSGIAIAAALVALAYTIDFPPGAQNAVGTIVPAQRFKAAQPAIDDVKAVGQSGSQSVPLQAGSAANAATSNAVSAGTSTNSGTAMQTFPAVTGSSVNAQVNATTSNAVGQASTQSINAAVQQGTANAVNAGATNAVSNASTNAVNNSATNAVSNASMNAVANGTTNAVNNSVSNATTNAVSNSVSNATNNAINGSSNNAVRQ